MPSTSYNKPAELLSEIVAEVEKLPVAERKQLLTTLRKSALLTQAKRLDSVKGGKKLKPMTDVEADEFISTQRRLRYEQKQA